MRGKKFSLWSIGLSALFSMQLVFAASIIVPMYLTDENGQGKNIGDIKIDPVRCGVLITPTLHDLTPGIHGFHIHEHATCANKAMAAGGHLDPAKTEKHEGPYKKEGHLGDLPVLIVNEEGRATLPVLAPNLTLSKLKNHALMIHEGGDNYADHPEKLGGGGARIACGVIS